MRPRTDRHTDARDHNTFCVVYDSTQNVINESIMTYADEIADDFWVLADDGDDDRRRVLVVRVALLDVRPAVDHRLYDTYVVIPTSLAQRRPPGWADLLYVGA